MSGKKRFESVLEAIKSSDEIKADALKNLTELEKETVYRLYDQGLVDEALKFIENLDSDQEWKVLKKIIINSQKTSLPLWKSVAKYAAIFIGFLAIVYLYEIVEKPETGTPIAEEYIRLKMGDEAVKIINEKKNQQIVSASGKVVGEQKGNKLRYDSHAEVDELIYNELEIPYGKIFDVELSDGTLVNLNSGTTMRFPVKFLKDQKREVFIDGEAYFKVAKDRDHPFVVNADVVAVEVLGTEFNISSYDEDHEVNTVLVEGSVKLSNSIDSKYKVMLKPGQKAGWNKIAASTEVDEVDVDLYTGWIQGEMIFRNATFENMAKKLERRYNVSIQNNNLLLKDKRLNARFNLDVESIEDVLNSIKEIQAFEYKITGQNVVID